MSTSTDVALVNNSFNKVNSGRDAIQDSWMVMWVNTNWGDLLQPAPVSVSLLGSVCVLASSVDDFSLVIKKVEGDEMPFTEWKYARSLDSFKTCLQQMVGDGCAAYETAHKSMTTIRNRAALMPEQIQQAVKIVFINTGREVAELVPDLIEGAIESAEICKTAAEQVETAFENMSGLAQEMVMACTHKEGTTEQILVQNKAQFEILKVQKEGDQRILDQRKKTSEMMMTSFARAKEDFHSAVKEIPTGWDLVGMQAVESIVGLAVSAGNAAISTYTLKEQVATVGIEVFKTQFAGGQNGGPNAQVGLQTPPQNTNPQGISTLPNDKSLSDPGMLEAPKTLQLVNALHMLLVGGKGGKPDWDKIRGKQTTSGCNYVKAGLQAQQAPGRLDTSKPISQRLAPLIDTAIRIVSDVMDVASSVGADDTALEKYKEPTVKLADNLKSLKAAVDLLLQQPGSPPLGMAAPQAPPANSNNTSAAKLAVESVKYKADVLRAILDTSRKSFEDASERFVDSQKQITATLAEITQITMANATLQNMLLVLKKAVATFTLLHAQFSKLTEFFVNVASLVRDVLRPSVKAWAKALDDTIIKLAGVTLSSVTKQFIYAQMMVPLKVCTLSEKIAITYLTVSDLYIMPAQRSVVQMLQFPDDNTPEGRKRLMVLLRQNQSELEKQATTATSEIVKLVQKDQKQFVNQIMARAQALTQGLEPLIPSITQPMPKAITDVMDTHLEDKKANSAAYDPAEYF